MLVKSTVGALLILLVLAQAAHAQTVTGTVYDAASEDVVPNAMVRLLDGEGTLHGSAVTNVEGVFALQAPEAGAYHLAVELIGYAATETSAFYVGPEATRTFEIYIEHAAIPLEPLVVTVYNEARAGFERRRSLSYGSRIGPEELAEIGDRSLNDFTAERANWLQYAGGELYTFPPRDSFGGRCNHDLAVVIDGVEFRAATGVRTADLDRWLHRDDVRAIEVYPDASLIPSPFFGLVRQGRRGLPPRCGLIAIWTSATFGSGSVE